MQTIKEHLLQYQGVHDCSTDHYPESPEKGDLWVCLKKTDRQMPNGLKFKKGDLLTYTGNAWEKL